MYYAVHCFIYWERAAYNINGEKTIFISGLHLFVFTFSIINNKYTMHAYKDKPRVDQHYRAESHAANCCFVWYKKSCPSLWCCLLYYNFTVFTAFFLKIFMIITNWDQNIIYRNSEQKIKYRSRLTLGECRYFLLLDVQELLSISIWKV